MELKMEKCVLCASSAQVRKYFFKDMPLCDMHYAEYLEFLLDEMQSNVTSKSASSAFRKYKLTLEPKPLSAEERAEKAKQEKEDKERAQRQEEWEEEDDSYEPDYSPSPYGMGM